MKENRSSLTALIIGIFTALPWFTNENHDAKLQAELLWNISWHHLSLPFWIFLRLVLCHEIISRIFLNFALFVLSSTKAINGVWMRKRYMEKQVRDFLDEHKKKNTKDLQVLILASGYDTLAWRLAAEYPHVHFIEFDHPATGHAKLSALQNVMKRRRKEGCSDSVLPSTLHFCHKEIGEHSSLQDALKDYIISNQKVVPTVVVMEGLSMYLTEKENTKIFHELGELFGDGDGKASCVVAFDYFYLDDFGKPSNPNIITAKKPWLMTLMKYKVILFGEPFKWGIAPEELPTFFKGTGWALIPSNITWPDNNDKCSDGSHSCSVMMGIEYEATVKWKGKKDD